MHPHATKENLEKALNDESPLNRYAAKSRLKSLSSEK
jgi:hypothetical protein